MGRPRLYQYPIVDFSKYPIEEVKEACRAAFDAVRVVPRFVEASNETKLIPQLDNEVVFAICERIAEGESLRNICKDEEMPKLSHLLAVAAENKVVGKLIEQAMRMRALAMGDDVVSEAERGQKEDDSAVAVASRKLLIDSKKWYASKLAPSLFGDKVEVDAKTTVNVVIRRFEHDAVEKRADA
jgi:hypothetical protein